MNSPLISIIIPVYNAEKYLLLSIESAINQTWPNKEIVLVDDGSKDSSWSIMQRYECDWIKIYQYGENKGQSYASNFGYLKSSGAFIKYLDADDIIEKDYLSNMMLVVDSEQDIYFSHCMNFQGDLNEGRVVPYPIKDWESMAPIDFLLSPISFMRQGGRWLLPRSVIDKAGLWDESLSLINDFEYFTRLSLNSRKVRYVKNSILYYRQIENSLSAQTSLNAYTSAFNSMELAGAHLLEYENSIRIRLYIANSLKGLLCSIYPRFSSLTSQIENRIKDLGGADKPAEAGGKTLILTKIVGWKLAFRLRHYAFILFRRKH